MTQDETFSDPCKGGRRGSQALGTQTQKRIGTHLRAMYDQIVQQPIPDRFKDLIDRLEDPSSSDTQRLRSD